MTIEQCQRRVIAIRRRQGTRCPLVRVDYGGSIFRGRLTRADCDPEHRPGDRSPSGVLVVEEIGQGRGPEWIFSIASLGEDGIKDVEPEGA
jgi:hypothetical protein